MWVATVDLWASCEKNTERVAVVLRGWRSWNSNWAPLESKDSRDMAVTATKELEAKHFTVEGSIVQLF